MTYLGDYPEDATVYVPPFSTHSPDTGAPIAPSAPFGTDDIKIFKNNGATAKATANGITVTSPFASVTGLHSIIIDTSVDTGDTGFWETGGEYVVVISPNETIDGNAALKTLASFSIERVGGALALIKSFVSTGSIEWPITIEDDDENPVADADVWITTDEAGANKVASGKTDAFGIVQPTPYLDAGDYYVWRQKSGVTFSNPYSITVS